MERFDGLIADHYDAEWKTYEMITMNQEFWMWRWVGPLMFLSGLDRAKEKITDKALFDEKMISMDERYFNI